MGKRWAVVLVALLAASAAARADGRFLPVAGALPPAQYADWPPGGVPPTVVQPEVEKVGTITPPPPGADGCGCHKGNCLHKLLGFFSYCPLAHRVYWTDCSECRFYHGFVPPYFYMWNPCVVGPGHVPPALPKHVHPNPCGHDCYNGPRVFTAPYPPYGSATPPEPYRTDATRDFP